MTRLPSVGALLLSSALCVLVAACGPAQSGKITPPGPTNVQTGEPGITAGAVSVVRADPLPARPLKIESKLAQLERPWRLPELQQSLPTYELQIPEGTLEVFRDDLYAPEQPATFTYEGQSYPVWVRLRGASARSFPKKSWNVDFEDLRFEGREELNLVAEYQDQTMIVEKLAYDMLEAMRVPAPRTKYVRLLINGEYQGVYLDIEEVDKKWVAAHARPDRDPSIYRCGSWDCEMKTWRGEWQGDWDKKTNEQEPDDDLRALLDLISHAPEPQFAQKLEAAFDVDSFLRLMAAEGIIANNYVEDSQSYYLNDRVTGRWYYVPWDLNNSDARWWPSYDLDMTPRYDHPLFAFTLQSNYLETIYHRRVSQRTGYEPTFCNLRTRIIANPELRARLLELTDRARRELLDPAVLHPRIDAMHALLQPHMLADPYIDQEKFKRGRQWVRDFVTMRFALVEDELERLAQPPAGLVIQSFDPAGGTLELKNVGSAPISTSGLVVKTYLRQADAPANVPSRTLAPGESVTFTESELGLSFAPQGQVGLFDGVLSVAGLIDVLYYGALTPGQRYARGAGGEWEIE